MIPEKSFRNVEKLPYAPPVGTFCVRLVYKRVLPYIACINDEVNFALVLHEQVIGGI